MRIIYKHVRRKLCRRTVARRASRRRGRQVRSHGKARSSALDSPKNITTESITGNTIEESWLNRVSVRVFAHNDNERVMRSHGTLIAHVQEIARRLISFSFGDKKTRSRVRILCDDVNRNSEIVLIKIVRRSSGRRVMDGNYQPSHYTFRRFLSDLDDFKVKRCDRDKTGCTNQFVKLNSIRGWKRKKFRTN